MTAYRRSAPTCPTCHEAMEPHGIREPAALVDLCTKCGGVWIDWEDGDFTELARAIPPARAREIPRGGPGRCPRCNLPLAAEMFLESAVVLRCTECAGAVLPYASIGKIAAGTPADARADQEASGGDGLGAHPAPGEPSNTDAGAAAMESVWGRAAQSIREWIRSK